jgi:cellulose synthase/poly-beta-1,6-N-acetylglucosamine synthase-like glycosyltransferase
MIAAAFWISVALVFYAYLGYPMALAIISLFRNRPVRKRTIAPRVSFIITAHNEEARIGEKIDNTLGQTYPADALEVIVASDCSNDRGRDRPRLFTARRLARAPGDRARAAQQSRSSRRPAKS